MQDWADIPQAPDSTLSPYVDAFAKLMIVGAAILALMSAGRIYNNWNLGSESMIKSVTNLVLGMIFMVSIYLFITRTF